MTHTLTLSAQQMRDLGYQVIDLIVDHFEQLSEITVINVATPDALKEKIARVMPEHPGDIDSVMAAVREHIVGNMSFGDHPRFFAFVPAPSNFVGAMGDAIAAGINMCASNWVEASSLADLERLTVGWLSDAVGYPAEAGGAFVSGGSMANLSAVAVAREVQLGDPDPDSCIYCSDQTHLSVGRGLRILGFTEKQLRQVPTDAHYRIDSNLLASQIAADRAAGLRPFCVIANAGTTNTGAVDPLRAIASICEANDLWLHVDAAFGGGSILCERGRQQLDGIDLAHSITIDPHKWLFQPIESGCLLVRKREWLRQTFDGSPEYLADVEADEGEINYYQHGVQLTRQTRALKLWMSLQVFGAAAFRSAIEQGFLNAEHLQSRLQLMPDWEAISPATLGIVCFRFAPASLGDDELNRLNQAISDAMTRSRYAFVGTTVLRGIKALRMCPINPRTSVEDLDETLARLDSFARDL